MSIRRSRIHLPDPGKDVDGSTIVSIEAGMWSDGSGISTDGSPLYVLDPGQDSVDPRLGIRDRRLDIVERLPWSIEAGMRIIVPPPESIDGALKVIERSPKIIEPRVKIIDDSIKTIDVSLATIDASLTTIDGRRKVLARRPSGGAPAPWKRESSPSLVARALRVIAPEPGVVDGDRPYT